MDERIEDAWPNVPRLCFGPGEPSHLNASVDWIGGLDAGGAHLYVYGYRRAAEALFKHVVQCERMSPDYIVFPFAFLWRHHLELALKSVIASGRELEGEDPTYPASHVLRDLWCTAKSFVVEYGDPNSPEVANVEANIEEFERIDPAADGFRYSKEKKGTSHALKNLPGAINLAVLHEGMMALSNFLDAVHECQRQALDAAMEIQAWHEHG